jgi:hypothetical protein
VAVTNAFMRFMVDLRVLDMRMNPVEEIAECVFDGLVSLADLKLSVSSVNCLLASPFRSLSVLCSFELTHFFLVDKNNNYSNSSDVKQSTNEFIDARALHGLTSLQSLKITGFKDLKMIAAGCFKQLANIRSIQVSETGIVAIAQDNFNCRYLSNIETLNLSRNKLLTCPCLAGLRSLKSVDLSHNRIQVLETGALDWLCRLKELNVGSNPMRVLRKQLIEPLVRLQWLGLDGLVLLRQIEEDVFNRRATKKVMVFGDQISRTAFEWLKRAREEGLCGFKGSAVR